MTATDGSDWSGLREIELHQILEPVLQQLVGRGKVVPQAQIGPRLRPDFLVQRDSGADVIVEVKGITPSTRSRLADASSQLKAYQQAYLDAFPQHQPPELVLAIPGSLSSENLNFLLRRGIDRVIDGLEIRAAVDSTTMLAPPRTNGYQVDSEDRALIEALVEVLDAISPGKSDWVRYQSTCRDLLAYLLAPPLNYPLSESTNSSGVNRRDIIFPNYAMDGFWSYIRETYSAHFIVADAKNYSGKVKKKDVLQLANYLSTHGTGLFGFIVTRNSGDNGAEVTRREQWFMHGKMIIVLSDSDLRQMVTIKFDGKDPAEHLRQKIEDFRLSF